ncbi:MAG: ATP-dependent helicase/nuclease subunit B [Candidatus Poriferisodalaceae bacterium]
MLRVRPTPFGRPAAERLRQLISDIKADDPLVPVTVLVPTNYVGVSIRRQLASGELGQVTSAGTGLVGIDLLTPYRMAELFGAPILAEVGRRPVSNPVVAAAVRGVLNNDPGLFAGVLEHPSTERSLVRLHRELRDLAPDQLDVLAAGGARAADVIRIHRAVDAALCDQWYDEFDLMSAAVEVFATGPALLLERGHILLHLPQDLTLNAAAMLRAAAEHVDMTVLAGVVGVAKADEATAEVCRRLGATLPSVELEPTTADHIVSASDADDEVRTVVRHLIDALRSGTPLERMAVLYGSDEPYGRLLDEQLRAAGIARNGDAVRTLAETLVGRTVLALLGLPDRSFRRADVLDLLASAPIRKRDGQPGLAPVNAWERVARRAGVVGGLSEWNRRLGQLITDHRGDVDELQMTDPESLRITQLGREIRQAEQLLEFVTELADRLGPGVVPTTWSGIGTWARSLLARYLGSGDDRHEWPDLEVEAAERIDAAFDRLAGLDEVEPTTSLLVFRRTLELELDSGLGRVGSLGEGLFVGRVGQALGLDLDRVFVLGMAEGTFPGRRSDDSLMPDAERSALDGALAQRSNDVNNDHRLFLAALASASVERILFFPRGDLRRSSERVHSRWLLDTAEQLAGERRQPEDLHRDAHDPSITWISEVPSFVAGIRRSSFPATEQEYDLASLLAHHEAGLAPRDHDLRDQSLAYSQGIELIEARGSRRFTRFDGNLSNVVTAEGVRTDVVSPTRLEGWAACPHRYLFQSVLGVAPVERPDEVLRISPLDQGSLVHNVLDLFVTARLEAMNAGDHWTPAEAQRHMTALADEECDRVEARGQVGKDIFWRRDRRVILNDLVAFLEQEGRREIQGAVVQSELGFGIDGARQRPVPLDLSNGQTVRFRGSIDRVERAADGRIIVIDYKTGNAQRFTGLTEEDPDKRGTKLQLPVYAHAARVALGEPNAAVHAAYWFITEEPGRWKWVGLNVNEQVMRRFDEVVSLIINGINAGVFPHHPDPRETTMYVSCEYCDPDGLGTRDLRTNWMRKRLDPAVIVYTELAEPEAVLDV